MFAARIQWPVVSVLVGLMTCSFAIADPKADPTPVDNRPKGPDIAAFADAYKRAGEPEILVVCGIVAGGQETGQRDLANYDPSADSDALRRRIEENLLNARVELKEQSVLKAVDQRELALLAQHDESKAIDALKLKFNADMVLMVQMQPLGGDARYRVTVDTLWVTRGTKIGTFSFDWEQGTDARSVKAYGDAVTTKVMDQFIRFFLPGTGEDAAMRYTVLLIGVEDNQLIRQAQQAFAAMKNVTKARVRSSTDAGGRKAATLEIEYAGAMFDLETDLQDTASKVLGMKVDGLDANSGTITLVAGGPIVMAPPPVDPCTALFDPSSDHNGLFKTLYKGQSRPRITILINREVFQGQRQNQENSGFLVNGPPPGATTHPLLQTATAENSIADWFKKLDVRVVNADQVRQRVQQSSAKANDVFNDDELRKILKDADVADILILGRGGFNTDDNTVWYTFEATKMGGDNLGNVRWISGVDVHDRAAVDAAFDNLAEQVVCKLSHDMMADWRGNSHVDVVVDGVKDPSQAYAIMDGLKKSVDGIVSADLGSTSGGRNDGVARFSLEYSIPYEELVRRITDQGSKSTVPFTVESSSRETVTLHVGAAGGH